MPVIHNPAAHVLMSASANGNTGAALDCRAGAWGYFVYYVTGNSAIFSVDASHDLTGWLPVATFTGAANASGTAQFSGYFPFIRAYASAIYSAAGGSARVNAHYTPLV